MKTLKNFFGESAGTDFETEIKLLPPVESLPPGKYKGLHYSLVFELEDGRKFRTKWGPKCSRRMCGGYRLMEVTPDGEFIGTET